MIYKKPDKKLFASGAKSGELVEFPDINRGWGVTENTGFVPPMEYFNGAFNRVDENMLYILQNGVMAWDSDLEYPTGALTQIDGIIYLCKNANINQNPTNNDSRFWEVILATRSHVASELKKLETKFLPLDGKAADSDKLDGKDSSEYALKSEINTLITQATEEKAGIVKIKNSITGSDEDVAVTEKAVKEAINELMPTGDLNENGYIKLANGLILQWGTYVMSRSSSSSSSYFTLPITFPNKLLHASLVYDEGNVIGESEKVGLDFRKTNKSSIYYFSNYAGKMMFFAIGY